MINKTLDSRDENEKFILKSLNQRINVCENQGVQNKKNFIYLGKKIPNFPISSVFGDCYLQDFQPYPLLMFFYPKDNTSGCTTETLEFTDLHNEFLKLGFQVVGVSRDSIKSHRNFYKKYNLSVNLISDETEQLCSFFGVLKEKNLYGKKYIGIERSTFLIDSAGILKKLWRGVRAQGHAKIVFDEIKLIL